MCFVVGLRLSQSCSLIAKADLIQLQLIKCTMEIISQETLVHSLFPITMFY